MSEPSLVALQRFTYRLIAVIAVIYVLSVLESIILPMIFAALVAIFLLPVDRRVRRWTIHPILGVVLSLASVAVPSLLLFFFFGWQLSSVLETLPDITGSLLQGVDRVEAWISSALQLSGGSIDDKLSDNVGSLISTPLSLISDGLLSTTAMVVGVGMTIIYSFLFLLYRKSFFTFIVNTVDDDNRHELRSILVGIKDTVQSYVGGMGLVILILTVLNSLGLWGLGVEYPIFWGTMAAVLAIIPYVGTIVGSLLPVLYTFAAPAYPLQPLAIMVYFGFVQQLEGNLITPKIVGDQVDVNPLFAIISIVAFSHLWGVAGAILAIPLTALCRIVMSHFDHLKHWSILLSSDMYQDELTEQIADPVLTE
jgi:predicted PurR-regulated permease PerM